jgi:RNA polymerase sigma-70 factor (family 1)
LSLYTDYSEERLLEAIRQSDEKAFAELFNRYWRKAHVIAYSKVHNKQVTEEIVQDLFVTLWDKRTTLIIHNINAYLCTSIKNKALNYIESCIVKRKYWEYYKAFVPQAESSTEKMVEYNELMEAIENGMERLPKKAKRIFQLNRLEGRSIAEIAKLLNLSEKAIEYHLTNSVKHLKLLIKNSIVVFCYASLYCLHLLQQS